MKFLLTIIFLSFAILGYSQSEDKSVSIYSFNASAYSKTAKDTINEMISQQRRLRLKDEPNAAYRGTGTPIDRIYIGNHYRLKELKIISVPVFRIFRQAFAMYDCDKNFETFITFDERLKYQHTLIAKDGKYLRSIMIPNQDNELHRIFSGGSDVPVENHYYPNSLSFFEGGTSEEFEIIKRRPNNFFFEIFGMEDFLFEIENGKIYAQFVGPCGCVRDPNLTDQEAITMHENFVNRAPINEYIKKNDLVDYIKQIALGFYIDDWENPKLEISKKCPDYCPEGLDIVFERPIPN